MIDIKVSLNILVPGATMYSEQSCSKNDKGKKVVLEEMTEPGHVFISVKNAEGKMVRQRIDFRTRKCIPACQVLNMSTEAYEYMISKSVPEWFRVPGGSAKATWEKMTETERLEKHLERTAAHFHGTVENYQVLGD